MVLRYLTTLTYPSRYVNRMQVLKMAEQFSRHATFSLSVSEVAGDIKKVFEEYGIMHEPHIEIIPFSKTLWPRSLFAAYAIAKKIRDDDRLTIYYTRDILLAYFLTFFSRRFRERFFFELHSLEKVPHMVYRRVFIRALGVISSNQQKREEVVCSYQVPEEQTFVAHNGFDANLFPSSYSKNEARTQLGLSGKKPIALYSGSLQQWKGYSLIEDMAGELPEVQFIIMGGDRDEVKSNIMYISKKPYHEVPLYLSAADILIAPYPHSGMRVEYYFSPIKLFEYMTSSVPIIVTDLSSVREVLSDDSAFFVREYTLQAFCEAVRGVLKDLTGAAKRAAKAREDSQEYSWEKRAKNILSFMQLRAETKGIV